MELTPTQQKVLKAISSSNKSILLLGKPGTGKSTFIKYIKNNVEKNIVVVAPTGIAAININGQTIHSLFKFPPQLLIDIDIETSHELNSLIKRIKTIIIDEISMVSADKIDAIDRFLKHHKENDKPFGGIQIVCVGDLFQLPPVITDQEYFNYYDGRYFFYANIFKEFDFDLKVELTKSFRHSDDPRFLRILDDIRIKTINSKSIDLINLRYIEWQKDKIDKGIVLHTRNYDASVTNQKKLDAITGKEFSYLAIETGNYLSQAEREGHRNPIVPIELILKVGAQVMFLANDSSAMVYQNGTLGVVKELSIATIKVQILNRTSTIDVPKYTWEKVKYVFNEETEKLETEVIGSYEQYPLKLAWAITIHKSQGQTYNVGTIDRDEGFFELNHAYVALSRFTSLDSIYLRKQMQPQDFKIDQKIIEYLNLNRDDIETEELVIDDDFQNRINQLLNPLKKGTELFLSTITEHSDSYFDLMQIDRDLSTSDYQFGPYSNEEHRMKFTGKRARMKDGLEFGYFKSVDESLDLEIGYSKEKLIEYLNGLGKWQLLKSGDTVKYSKYNELILTYTGKSKIDLLRYLLFTTENNKSLLISQQDISEFIELYNE